MQVTDQAISRVEVDSSQAESALKQLREQAKALKKEYDELKFKNDPGAAKKKRELAEINKQIDDARKGTFNLAQVMKNLNGSSLKELSKAQRQLTADIRNATRNTKEEVAILKEKQAQLKKVNTEIDKVRSGMSSAKGGFLTQAASAANKYFTLLTGAVATITGVVFSIKSMVQRNAELSDSMADVAKATGLSMSEVKDLNKELRKIDTRTGRKELLDLAYVAGKLGYSSKTDVLGFVKAADQIGIALAKDLGGNTEEAVNNLGKIVDIFKVKGKFGIEEALLKTGSAINSLGAASTANEAYIVDFTKRLGGIAPQANISVQNIMGLGATLDQLGQQTETSSTAISQLLTKMFQKPGEYAQIAGMNVQDFSKLLKTDANEALIMLLTGLQKNKGGMMELAEKFKDLGVDGSRSIGVIGALSNNVDLLRQTQALSNKEFDKGTSLTNEFNIKNQNMAANLAKIGRGLMAAFVNSDVMSSLDRITAKIADWFKIPLSKKIEEDRIQVNILANKLFDANLQLGERKKIITELNGIAPSVVNGINAESIAYDTLRRNLAAYNKEALNRVIIERYQEDIDDQNKKLVDLALKRGPLEEILNKQLIKLQESAATNINTKVGAQIKMVLQSGDDIITQAQRVKEILNANQSALNARVEGVLDMSHTVSKILLIEDKEQAIVSKQNAMYDERNKLMKEFGLTAEEATKKIEESMSAGAGGGEGTSEPGTASDTLTNYQLIQKAVEDATKAIQELLAVNKPVPNDLIRQLVSKQAELDRINATIKEIAAGLQGATAKPAGLIPVVDNRGNLLVKRPGEAMGAPAGAEDFKLTDEDKNAIGDAAISSAQSISNAIYEINSNRIDAELNKELSALDKAREKQLSNKHLTESQKAAIEAKYDEKARKLKQDAWKKQQDANIKMALINGGLAITKTFAEYGFTPAGWAAAAAQAVATGAEVMVMKKQEVPQFYTGGDTGSGSTMQPAGTVHKNEYVIPAWERRIPQVMAMENIIEAIRLRGYAAGGSTPVAAATSQPSLPVQADPVMITAINRFAEAVDKLDKNGVKGKWVYNDFTNFADKVNETESRTGL